jgi:very-short-patch-repair endonuclease
MKKPTEAELLMEIHLNELGLVPWEPELRFDTRRKWRFDYAVPRLRVAIEIEGGIFPFRNARGEMTVGGHVRGAHYQSDLDKYNTAAALGWRVFRFSTEDIVMARDIICLRLWIAHRLESNRRARVLGKAETASRDKHVSGAAVSGESSHGGTRAVSRALHV